MRNRVKYRRQSLDVKQKELAEVLDISRQTLSAIERERYNLTLSLAYKITKALGCSYIEELFSFEDEDEELPEFFPWENNDNIGKYLDLSNDEETNKEKLLIFSEESKKINKTKRHHH